jgi:hypothetical protein
VWESETSASIVWRRIDPADVRAAANGRSPGD